MKLILIILCSFFFIATTFSQIIEEDNAGEFATDFSYVDLEDKTYRLGDFKGKVVYISFWASWCQPCIEGFKKYKDTRIAMEEKGVVMLNISIDKDEAKWRAAVDKYDINGLHGWSNDQDLIDTYQLYSIPSYEIVGKRGEFHYLDREGGKTVLDNFDAFIKL